MNFQIDPKSTEDQVLKIQSRAKSDPPLSDIDFKTKMAWVWTTLKVFDKHFLKWSPHCAHVIRVRGYEFVQQVKANKFCSDIPQIDLSKMLRANDIEKIPVIHDFNAKQMENFCHNLLSDIACKSKMHDEFIT